MITSELYEFAGNSKHGSGTIDSTGQSFSFSFDGESGWLELTIFKIQSDHRAVAEYRHLIDHDNSDTIPLSIVVALLNRFISAYISESKVPSRLATVAD